MTPEDELEWEMFGTEVEAMVAALHVDGVVNIVGWWKQGLSCGIVMDHSGR